jgi:dihydrofolate synthase/folylpolyglutamate synthase
VAHNPHAAQRLAENLDALRRDDRGRGRTLAVFGMLKDKDIAGVAAALAGRIDGWWVAGLPGERGASAEQVRAALEAARVAVPAESCADAAAAFRRAREAAGPDDRIVVFGSFLTVSAVLALADGPHR